MPLDDKPWWRRQEGRKTLVEKGIPSHCRIVEKFVLAEILDLALPFFGLVALGVAAARIWAVADQGFEWLNIFLIWFALSALIFLVDPAPHLCPP